MMRTSQQGNVLPYVAALLIAVAFSIQYIYGAYKASNESTRLQNTVDAAAYSTAVVSAQTYNFIALSNRSLIANQITVAQLATMTSWTRMLRTFVGTVKSVTQYFPYIGQVTTALDELADSLQQAVEAAMPAALQVMAQYLNAVSKLQQLSTVPTAVISDEVLQSVVEKNDPNISVSVATIAAVSAEVTTQINSWSRNDCKSEADSPSATDNDVRKRCRQFHSIMLASRDGLTKERKYQLGPEVFMGPALPIPKGDVPIAAWITMMRGRGTTMTGANKLAPFRTWSALDTVSLHVRERWLDIIWKGVKTKNKDFGEVAKLGSGAAVAGNDDCGNGSSCYVVHDSKDYWRVNPKAAACIDLYQHPISVANLAMDILSFAELSCSELTDHDKKDISDGADLGMKHFYELNDKGLVSDKDHIMVYLRKHRKYMSAYSNTFFGAGSSPEKRLDSYGGAENNSIHAAAAAAAKVYFRRDTDTWMLPEAKRLDNRIEFGNAYNPYWEVTLDKLTSTEKAEVLGFKALSAI